MMPPFSERAESPPKGKLFIPNGKGVGEGFKPSRPGVEPEEKPGPTAISITATFLGQASFNVAEVVAVRHRFDMAQMRSLTDVEILLRFIPPAPEDAAAP